MLKGKRVFQAGATPAEVTDCFPFSSSSGVRSIGGHHRPLGVRPRPQRQALPPQCTGPHLVFRPVPSFTEEGDGDMGQRGLCHHYCDVRDEGCRAVHFPAHRRCVRREPLHVPCPAGGQHPPQERQLAPMNGRMTFGRKILFPQLGLVIPRGGLKRVGKHRVQKSLRKNSFSPHFKGPVRMFTPHF